MLYIVGTFLNTELIKEAYTLCTCQDFKINGNVFEVGIHSK
jgi:hypothetical protein